MPRTGGTSMKKKFNVPAKCKQGRSLWHKVGLTYFFYRYRLLEKANFPFLSWENAYAFLLVFCGFIIWASRPELQIEPCQPIGPYCPPGLSIYLWCSGSLTFFLSTFIMNAQLARHDFTRRLMMLFVHVLCEWTSSNKWIHVVLVWYGTVR